jgi:hypothetical protein
MKTGRLLQEASPFFVFLPGPSRSDTVSDIHEDFGLRPAFQAEF